MDIKASNGFIGVIVPAAGSGSRMGGVYKPLEKLCGRSMLLYSLEVFEKSQEVSFVVVAAREDKIEEIKALCTLEGLTKVKAVVVGGKDRQESVSNAFSCSLFDDEAITHVAVHDAARPLFDCDMAKKVFSMAKEKGNAVCAQRVRDTVKRADGDDVINASVERDGLWLIQTPQVFEKNMYKNALSLAQKQGFVATDESSLVENSKCSVYLCETPSHNIKITYSEDVFLAEAIINRRKELSVCE